jgi:hypothetical protein
MSVFIALPLVLLSLLAIAGGAFAWYRRRGRLTGRQLNEVSPVSRQWLSDHRRGG